MHALPITACGLRLDDEAIKVAVGLLLGINLCISHMCPCGLPVGAGGAHSLTCKQSSASISKHHIRNETIYRACISAHIPATKKPVGLSRTDGKRLDGLTLIPWQRGNAVSLSHGTSLLPMRWPTHMSRHSIIPGGVAEHAANRKEKYGSSQKATYSNHLHSKQLFW